MSDDGTRQGRLAGMTTEELATLIDGYHVTVTYADGRSETEHETEATLMGVIRRCLSYPSVARFEVVKDGYEDTGEEVRP